MIIMWKKIVIVAKTSQNISANSWRDNFWLIYSLILSSVHVVSEFFCLWSPDTMGAFQVVCWLFKSPSLDASSYHFCFCYESSALLKEYLKLYSINNFVIERLASFQKSFKRAPAFLDNFCSSYNDRDKDWERCNLNNHKVQHSFARKLHVVQVTDPTVHIPIQNCTAEITISSDSVLVDNA